MMRGGGEEGEGGCCTKGIRNPSLQTPTPPPPPKKGRFAFFEYLRGFANEFENMDGWMGWKKDWGYPRGGGGVWGKGKGRKKNCRGTLEDGSMIAGPTNPGVGLGREVRAEVSPPR